MNASAIEKWDDVFVVAGPTASGKSALAVELALQWGAEILSADAYQVYRGLAILTAQPDAGQLARAPHHLVGALEPSEVFSPADFARRARGLMEEIRGRDRRIIVVGGAGFYLEALFCGLPETPPPDEAIRERLAGITLLEQVAELGNLDPAALETVDLQNPRRVQRALEICLATGKPFTSFARNSDAWPLGLVLDLPPEILHSRIETRTDAMLQTGALDEVRNLESPGVTCEKTIGLREIASYQAGLISFAECRERIIIATRQYAKRQRTWFRNRSPWKFVSPAEAVDYFNADRLKTS